MGEPIMPFMGYASPRSPRSPGSGGLPGGVTEVTVLIHRARGERVGLRIFSPDERPVTVVRGVARGGPADRAGLQVGDQLLAVGDRSVLGMAHEDIISLLAKSKREMVLTVLRQRVRESSPTSPKPGGLADELINSPEIHRRGPPMSPQHQGPITSQQPSGSGDNGAADTTIVDQKFAALVQVPLPAQYHCVGIMRREGLPGPCALHAEPTLASEKVGLVHAGMYVTVSVQRGSWLFVEEPSDSAHPAGWVNAGSGGREYLVPVAPQKEYSWQRARGTGVYDSVLEHRKAELLRADLAGDPALLKEWNTVVAELDVALRIRARVDASGWRRVDPERRPRAMSFQNKWNLFGGHGNANGSVSSSSSKPPPAMRKRSQSFAQGIYQPPSGAAIPPYGAGGGVKGGGQGLAKVAEVAEGTHAADVRDRWRKLQSKNESEEWDARTTQRHHALVSERKLSGRPKHHALGRLARDRAAEIKVRVHSGQVRKPGATPSLYSSPSGSPAGSPASQHRVLSRAVADGGSDGHSEAPPAQLAGLFRASVDAALPAHLRMDVGDGAGSDTGDEAYGTPPMDHDDVERDQRDDHEHTSRVGDGYTASSTSQDNHYADDDDAPF